MAQIVNPVRPDEIYAMTGEKFRYVVRDIGDWNMDTTPDKNILHLLDHTKIISVSGYIRNDADTERFLISWVKDHSVIDEFGVDQIFIDETSLRLHLIDATTIYLSRLNGSFFDQAGIFSSTPYNRGKLLIRYED